MLSLFVVLLRLPDSICNYFNNC